MISDHLHIHRTILGYTSRSSPYNSSLKVPRNKLFHRLSHWAPPLNYLNLVAEVENAAENISSLLKDAIRAIGRQTNQKNGLWNVKWSK